MVRNKLATAILALSMLQADVAGALGLGNLSVKSALNQPLSAEIKLLDMGDLDASQVKIQLGTPEDFQRASVERDFFLTNLKFNVELDGRGGGVIRIVTREPVVEPYLNFVIEARWPNGRLLREFAVLLDPPTFAAKSAAAPVAPAKSGGATPMKPTRVPVQPPTVTAEAPPATAPAPADMTLPAAPKSGEYRIQVYDTLSKIAAQHKPADDVSVEQTMIAIQRANPQVFIRNNVNLIKSGYVVRLPSADETRAITAAQAAQEVDDQIKEWRGGGSARSSAAVATTGPQLDARAPEPTNKEGGYKEQARLSIATPGNSDKSSAGEGSGAAGKGVEALRNQLAVSQESLEKGRRDNHELQSRLDDMERQIATLQRLISLKDDQLAALQSRASADKAIVKETPAPPIATAPTATPVTAPATGEAAATTTPATPAAPTPTPAPTAQSSTTASVSKTTIAPAKVEEPGLFEQLTANPLYVGGAGAVALLLAGFAIQRRRKAAEEREAMGDVTLDDQDSFQFDNLDFENARVSDDAVTTTEESSELIQDEPTRAAQPQAVRSETGDAIAESDIYIAYGRYQQAVDLLSHAIDAEPARSDLRVKLLEVCLEMRNKDAFRQQFLALQSLGDADAVAHAKDLLSSVDGVSDWLVDLPQTPRPATGTMAAVATAAFASAALADEEEPASTTELTSEQPFAEQSFTAENDLTLDDDLDFDFDAETEPAHNAPGLETTAEFELPTIDNELGADNELADTDDEPDFNFELEDDLPESTNRIESFDLDSTSIELASETAPPVDKSLNIEIESASELDLDHDDLDFALSEMGDTGDLSDLEELSDTLSDFESAPAAAVPPVAFDLDTDLEADAELDSGLSDLSDEFDLGNVEADVPESDRMDLAPPKPSFTEAEHSFTAESYSADSVQPAVQVPTIDEPADDEFDFLADADEVATKLDLARAYIDMGDTGGAKDILDEVLQEGTDTQKQEASTLLSRIG